MTALETVRLRAKGLFRSAIPALALLALLALAPAPAQARFGLISQWGEYGKTGPGRFLSIGGVAVGVDGTVYVSDYRQHRVQQFTQAGRFIRAWGSKGSAHGQFDTQSGLATDSDGNVYVADTGNERIQKFNSRGRFLTAWGNSGSGPGQFHVAQDIATDANGNVYVSDGFNSRIQKFSSSGAYMGEWGGYGDGADQLDWPRGIATDAAGNVYVLDEWGGLEDYSREIKKFTASGTFVGSWQARLNDAGTSFGVAVGPPGHVFVADQGGDRTLRFGLSGLFAGTWGTSGTKPGQFRGPWDLDVNRRGHVYVSDGDRIQRFGELRPFLRKCVRRARRAYRRAVRRTRSLPTRKARAKARARAKHRRLRTVKRCRKRYS